MALNGDIKELYNAIDKRTAILETKIQIEFANLSGTARERHAENKETIGNIFKRLDKLPCDSREGFFTYTRWHLGILTTIVLGIMIRLILK